MKVFISHNKADKTSARALATALVQQGVDVWFDEWRIRPGDSLTGGIEKGLGDADVFALVWSASAASSNWVGTEVRGYIRRRVDDSALRIVQVMVDETPLPVLVADYKGFQLNASSSLDEIASSIVGRPLDRDLARLVQERLLEVTDGQYSGYGPFPYVVCPACGSPSLKRGETFDKRGDHYATIECDECDWGDASEV